VKVSNHTSSDKDNLLCDFCGKSRYTRETCWKLHGRPNQGRGGKRNFSRPQANMSEAMEPPREVPNIEAFSNEEIQNLRRLLSQLESPSTTTAASNFVNSGNAFLANLGTCSWVIDSGANRHMTCSSKNFLSYSSCLKKENVHRADGSFR
jgi:hypothetical protein